MLGPNVCMKKNLWHTDSAIECSPNLKKVALKESPKRLSFFLKAAISPLHSTKQRFSSSNAPHDAL